MFPHSRRQMAQVDFLKECLLTYYLPRETKAATYACLNGWICYNCISPHSLQFSVLQLGQPPVSNLTL